MKTFDFDKIYFKYLKNNFPVKGVLRNLMLTLPGGGEREVDGGEEEVTSGQGDHEGGGGVRPELLAAE